MVFVPLSRAYSWNHGWGVSSVYSLRESCPKEVSFPGHGRPAFLNVKKRTTNDDITDNHDRNDEEVENIFLGHGSSDVVPKYISSSEEENEYATLELLKELTFAPETSTKLTFISSNPLKISEAKAILMDESDGCKFPFELITQAADLLEPQATPIEISRAKCIQALRLVDGRGPVCVEDTSLHFNALQGMPGPYIKSFYEAMGNEGLARMLNGFEDKSAYAQCVVSFSYGIGGEIHTFCGVSEGTIVSAEELANGKGLNGFGWDPLFIPDKGGGLTFGELDFEAKNRLSHRFKAFKQLKSFINARSDRFGYTTTDNSLGRA